MDIKIKMTKPRFLLKTKKNGDRVLIPIPKSKKKQGKFLKKHVEGKSKMKSIKRMLK